MKKDYMARLEKAARWRLPPQEAEDVISDYRDIVGAPPRRSEYELRREVGAPEKVVKLLVSPPETYRVWLTVFIVMSFCILTLGICPTLFGFPLWMLYVIFWGNSPAVILAVALVGAAAALIWFRRQGRKDERLPRAIPILLAAVLAWCGAAMLFCWMCAQDYEGFCQLWGTTPALLGPNTSMPRSYYFSTLALTYGCVPLALAGEFGLVKARTGDRRWAAVYVLALTAILMSILILCMTQRTDFTYVVPEEFFRQLLIQCAGVSAVGLVGAGVALC